jgi:adenylate cyclase
MGQEIERKYLVKKDKWRSQKEYMLATGIKYCQGYIPTTGATTVRLRVIDNQGYLTIKSKTQGHTRSEFEYPVPLQDAEEMLQTLCHKPLIEKIRYKVNHGELTWEIDEFSGDNAGLIIAEVELSAEDQQIDLPEWIDREVTDQKYFNSNLVKYPYSQWEKKV